MFLNHRPVVKFDPSNSAHRQAVNAFLRRNSWSDTELRFAFDAEHYGSVSSQVQEQLLRWYLEQDMTKLQKKNKAKEVKQEVSTPSLTINADMNEPTSLLKVPSWS